MTVTRTPYVASAASVPVRRPLLVAALGASAAVGIGLWLLAHSVTDRDRPFDFGSQAVWFLWATADNQPNVARQPGGAPLPGHWGLYRLAGDCFPSALRGSLMPRDPGAPPNADDGAFWAWRGGPTGERREIDGVTWWEHARWGGLTDLDELGRDSAFVRRWKCFAFGLPEEISLAADGRVLADGVPREVGRWAGRGRLLVIHPRGWSRMQVRRFLLDPADPLGDRFVLDEGCEISEVRRVR